MKRIITRIGLGLGGALVLAVFLRLALPVSPAGFWTGSHIQCMCGLGFAHFTESEAELFIGCHEPPEGWRAPLVRQSRLTWEVHLDDFTLNTDRTGYTILANRTIVCEPGWFWMKCIDMPEGNVFRLHRDFSHRSRQIIESETPAFTTEQGAERLLKRINERVQQAESTLPSKAAPSAPSDVR